MHKLITRGCIVLAAVPLSFVGLGVPAQAATPTVTVCNSLYSADNILLFNEDAAVSVYVNQGDCRTITDVNGAARVDVDPSGGEADIDSWKKSNGESYGPCYNNEDGSSNPYSGSAPYNNYTIYRTYGYTGC